jgi:phosphoribosylformimino-5-aminoimidazole carboxamide ribotide isomerase
MAGQLEIIPVIDLKGGNVVRAKAGERASYAPIETPLSRTPDPVEVAAGLLSVAAAGTLYVADLDAIEGSGDNRRSLLRLAAAFPNIALWIDGGVRTEAGAASFHQDGIGRIVLGSESQTSARLLRMLADRAVLSLDFKGETSLGPAEIHDEPSSWPGDVIVMTLQRVGSGLGPDLTKLRSIKAMRPDARVYAAGGLRHQADLDDLAAIGLSGVLVASALHDGRIARQPSASVPPPPR